MSAVLTVRGLAKSVPGPRVLFAGIELDLAPGEYVAIMGESGVGKSTLLNLLAGLDVPDRGSIVLDGRELVGCTDDVLTLLRRECIGFVFQAFHVLPYLTVGANVQLPLLLNRAAGEHEVAAMLRAVGLEGRADSMPRELSGGELQRVAIARALVHRPRLLLADEPTGNLDPEGAANVARLLRERVKEAGAAGIVVTHSQVVAATADRTLVLGRDGLRPA